MFRLVIATRMHYGIIVELREVFQRPILRRMAEYIAQLQLCASLNNINTLKVLSQENQTSGPATFQQRQIYLHSKTKGYHYLIPFEWKIPVDESILKSVNNVFKSISELRTVLKLSESNLVQIVMEEKYSPTIEFIEEEMIKEWNVNAYQIINIETGPVALFAYVNHTDRFIGVIHHAVIDGLGIEELRLRVLKCDDRIRSPSYIDYGYWQSNQDQSQYGTTQFSHHVDSSVVEMMIPSALLNCDSKETTFDYSWSYEWKELIQKLPQERRFIWILGKLCRALSRFTSRCDEHIVVASVIGNRWIETIGPMVNTVLYHWDVGLSEDEWIGHVLSVQNQHERSLESMKLLLHPDSYLPLTNIMITWNDERWWDMDSSKIPELANSNSIAGIYIIISENGMEMSCNWKERIWNSFLNQLNDMPSLKLPLIELPEYRAENHPLLKWLNNCEKYVSKVALINHEGKMTSYGEMLFQAKCIAGALLKAGVREGDVVVVDAERSLGLPIWILAIWMIGGTYFALNPNDSHERKENICRIVKSRLIITEEWLNGVNFIEQTSINFQFGKIAYLIATSGSTGEPKVIEISFFNLYYFYVSKSDSPYGYKTTDIVPQTCTVTFDPHINENIVVFLSGASLFMIPMMKTLDTPWLCDSFEEYGITYMYTVPSIWRHYVSQGLRIPHNLRVIIFGGEALDCELVVKIRQLTDCKVTSIYNLYGPAECTIEAMYALVENLENPIPIGRALSSYNIRIKSPEGVIGELYIGGPCVMERYLNVENPSIDGWYPTGDLCYQISEEYVGSPGTELEFAL